MTDLLDAAPQLVQTLCAILALADKLESESYGWYSKCDSSPNAADYVSGTSYALNDAAARIRQAIVANHPPHHTPGHDVTHTTPARDKASEAYRDIITAACNASQAAAAAAAAIHSGDNARTDEATFAVSEATYAVTTAANKATRAYAEVLAERARSTYVTTYVKPRQTQ